MPTTTPQAVWNRWITDPTSDMQPFMNFLRHRAKGNILEIGVRGGVSTAALLLGLEANGGHLWSIDIDLSCGDVFDHPQWSFVWGDSNVLSTNNFVVEEFDILLIDGDHTHPAVDHDLSHWSKMVRPGGMILMHDINPPENLTAQMVADGWGTEDVRDAYHQYIVDTGSTHFELPGKYGMGVIYKK